MKFDSIRCSIAKDTESEVIQLILSRDSYFWVRCYLCHNVSLFDSVLDILSRDLDSTVRYNLGTRK